ncbi:MAG TPA: hypothetical protein VK034_08240, partial [Enhygromyxa sp.]|nr:hypothetical protein [Enhygromyxa sp.]
YQNSLIRALGLSESMRSSGSEQLLIDEFPDDWAPAVRRLLASAQSKPAWTTDATELEAAVGLDYAVTRLAGAAELADTTLQVRRERELQERISAHLPNAVSRYWRRHPDDPHIQERTVRLSHVWPDPLEWLIDTPPPGTEHLIETYVRVALREFNIGTLRSLGQALAPTAERNDTLELERLISQARALQRDLGVAPLNTALASLEDYNRGQSQFLLMLYVHAATAMSMARGVVTERGHHVRTGTIFNYMMDAANSTTLTGTVRWLERVGGVHSFVEAMARVEASLRAAGERPPADQSQSQDNPASSPEPHWGAGTDLFPWLDALRMGIGRVGDVSQSLQEIEDGAHDPNSPLYHLLAAEAAGGGEARNAALAELGDRLRAADHAEAYVAARLLYASALQVPHLIHEYFKPKQVIDAETVLNTSMARTLLGPIPTPEIRRAQEVVDEYQRNLESNQTQLDRGRHPTLDRELSDNEKRWWESYKAISGRGRLLGEEELQGIQDFGKQLIFMIAIGAISGGVGSAFAGLAGGGTLATLTGMGIELAGITAASRMYGVATTGIRPETSFLEDFAVNVATMGAERLALRGYNAAFSLNPATAQLTRHVAGRLVTEYLATSIVTHAHMVIRAQVTGGPLTNDQIASSYLSNAAFLVAMKGRALLGPTSTAHFRRLFGQRGVDQVRADILTTRLAAHDDAIEDATRRAGEAETQVERDAALRDIEVAMQAKAELLERSRIRGLDDDIADFRAATRLFGSDAARARLFGAINVEPHPNSRDLTYSRGGASVDTIIRHFNEAGVPFRILEGIHGPIFELTAADGAVTRLEPRPAREFGGTSSETFLAQGRSAHEGLLLSGQHAELGDIIAADRQVPAYLRSQLGGGQSRATISAAGVSVRVELRLVDDYSAGTGGHDPGPAQYRLDYRDGQFVATVEVLTRATNDQMGRGVTHEVIEIQRAVELLVEDAQRSGTDLSRYEAHDTIDAVLTRERDARALRPGGEGAEPSADDLGRLAEFRYLAGKMHEVRDALERFPSPDEAAALRERLELLEAEYRRTWRASGLSVDADVLASQLGRFPDSALDASTRAAVEEARVTATLGWESRGGVRALDIQLMLRALHAANPDLVAGVTIHDMGAYYQSALAARAQRIYDAELTRTSDPDLALAAAVESVRAGMGGTSLASWRGRAFEGLSADELNGDPLFRSQYGQMHLLTRNNYPTYDAVSVRGTSEGLQPPDESPRINPDGSQTRRLRIRSQSGTLLFEWLGTNPPTTWTAGGIDVTLWSDKARGSFDMVAGYRATGSAQTPHRHGRMLGTPEFADAIDRSIAWTQQRVTTLQAEWNAGDTSVAPELARMRRRLSGLQHFQTQLETSSGWSNARIDSLLEQLRGSQLDIDAIIDGVYVHAAGGPAPTPGGTGGGATGGGGSP